jgi:phage terminase large subunit
VQLIDKIFIPLYSSLKNGSKRYIVNEGGTRSGKTFTSMQSIIMFLSNRKKNTLFSIVASTLPALKRGALRDFLQIMQTENLYKDENFNKTDRIYKFSDNVHLEFFSADDKAKVFGAGRDYLYIFEAQNIKRDTFIHLDTRTRISVICDFNPTHHFWAHDLPLSDTTSIHSTYLDNPYLSYGQIQAIENQKGNPNYWRVFGLGLVGVLENIIFSNWGKITKQEYDNLELTEYFGLDFGYNDPAALVGCKYKDKSFYFDEKFYKSYITEYPEHVGKFVKNNGSDIVVCDNSRPEIIKTLQNNNFYALPCIKKTLESINLLQSCKVYYTETSKNIEYEYLNYEWRKDKDENILDEPVDKDNHQIDGARYIALWLKYYLHIM